MSKVLRKPRKHRRTETLIDLVVEGQIIVELKTVKGFEDTHLAQVISYLKATKLKVGLLLNFSKSVLKIKRVVN